MPAVSRHKTSGTRCGFGRRCGHLFAGTALRAPGWTPRCRALFYLKCPCHGPVAFLGAGGEDAPAGSRGATGCTTLVALRGKHRAVHHKWLYRRTEREVAARRNGRRISDCRRSTAHDAPRHTLGPSTAVPAGYWLSTATTRGSGPAARRWTWAGELAEDGNTRRRRTGGISKRDAYREAARQIDRSGRGHDRREDQREPAAAGGGHARLLFGRVPPP